MGLRCSLLGHAFGEPVTERERETRGAEVLITVREVRRCSRCDTEQVITENKEIRHLGSEDAGSSAASATGEKQREATSSTASDVAGEPETVPDCGSGATAEPAGEPATEPGEADAGTTDAEAESAEIVSESAGSDADDEVDVSDLVDAAEEPDAGGPGRSPPVGDTGDADEAERPDEDVEFIDADTDEEESTGPAAERTGGTGQDSEAPTSDADREPETADEVGETAAGETDPADAPSEEGERAEEESEEVAQEDSAEVDPGGSAEVDPGESAEVDPGDAGPEADDPSERDAEPEPEDAGPPDDDAVILDNDAGKEARESDVGRRELAGSGNMFDPSAPEDQETHESASDPSPSGDAGDDAESWPGREVEGRVDEPGDSEPGSADPTEWPTSEPVEDGTDESDSAFQFDQDRLEEENEAESGGKTPSGLTSEGPVDVAGDPEASPPTSVECPECGYTAEGVGSSLRAGDICPDCHDAYLADRR